MEWILLAVVAFLWRSFSARIKRLESERTFHEKVIRDLTSRLYRLENPHPVKLAPPAPPPVLEPTAPPAPPEPEVGQVPDLPTVPPHVSEPPHRNWEAIIGGNWLNAAGVLILVISLSLFLGYALTQFGPAGKIGIGFASALAMLAAGIVIERREAYAMLGRGLIAGGWAALYFTAYAAHALPAARVIDSPTLAAILLLAVAAGMIAHSLRYRSQNLTLLSFFTAYLALQLQPLSGLGIAASIPLAVALLAISRALQWKLVPVAGLLLTYFTFAFRYDGDALLGAAALYAYWVVFEVYDLLTLREGQERGLFLLNAIMILGTATMTLPPSSAVQSSNFLASLGVLFGVSTWLRMQWGASAQPVHSLLKHGYRIGVALSSAMFAAALVRRFPGIRGQIGLMLEGQLLILAFVRTGDWIFKRTSQGVFAAALLHFVMNSTHSGKFANSTIGHWVPVAFVMAVLFYINRRLTREGPEWTWPAAGLMMLASGGLLDEKWFTAAWMALALALVEAHVRTRANEFRWQAAAIGALAAFAGCAAGTGQPMFLAAALAYAGSWRWHQIAESFRAYAAAAGTLLAAWACWHALPAPLVAVAWGAIGLVLYETPVDWLRWQAHATLYAAFTRTFFANFPAYGETAGISHRLLTVLPLIAVSLHAWLTRVNERWVSRGYSYAAVVMAVALTRFELGRTLTVVPWAALMLFLYYVGLRRDWRDLRWQAYALAVLTFARSWATNFLTATDVVCALVAVGAFHAAQFLTPRAAERHRAGFALLGVSLLSLVLYFEASGQMLTIAWGVQAAATLAAGFASRDRILRLAGLALFPLCILKLFVYDLRNLETLARIASFFVLGLVLIGASWLYMRFRDKIERDS